MRSSGAPGPDDPMLRRVRRSQAPPVALVRARESLPAERVRAPARARRGPRRRAAARSTPGAP